MREIPQLWMDQLWKLTVVWPAWLLTPDGRTTLFSRASFWKLMLGVVTLVAIIALAQTLPADLAVLAAGDVASYFEIAAIVWLTGAVVFLRAAMKATARSGLKGLVRFGRVAVRRRAMRRRRPRRLPPPANDDDPAGVVCALAA